MILLALAGIAAPLVFTAGVVGLGLLNPAYSHVALPISALAAWSAGWLQDANFHVTGALLIAFAVGLHRGLAPAPRGALGPALLAVSGLGLVVDGLYPIRAEAAGLVEPAGHIVGAFMAFLGAGIGYAVLSRRMARDPAWRSLARYALGSGLVIVAMFFAYGLLARAPAAPLHPWGGLVQRVAVAAWLLCTLVLALRLLRHARGGTRG